MAGKSSDMDIDGKIIEVNQGKSGKLLPKVAAIAILHHAPA